MIWGTRHIIGFFSLPVLAASMLLPRDEVQGYTPTISKPSEGVTWDVGATEQVIWNTDDPPADIDQCTPILYILDNSTQYLPDFVANNFTLSAGHIEIIVPSLLTKKYRLQLNCSHYSYMTPLFTIHHP